MKKIDLIYRNTGRSLAHRIQQTAFNISRSNVKDGPWNTPNLMSEEAKRLAKLSAPGNGFDIPYAGRERFAVSDEEREAWRRFNPGDALPCSPDPLSALIESDQSGESEEEPELDDEEPEEELEAEENEQLARTENAFDRARLFRAIDRLTRRTKKCLGKGHDGRSYARDNRSGRSYAACTGMLGGVDEWNAAFARGEVC